MRPARLAGRRRTGGRVEILLVDPLPDGSWTAMARPGRRLLARLRPEEAVGLAFLALLAVPGLSRMKKGRRPVPAPRFIVEVDVVITGPFTREIQDPDWPARLAAPRSRDRRSATACNG